MQASLSLVNLSQGKWFGGRAPIISIFTVFLNHTLKMFLCPRLGLSQKGCWTSFAWLCSTECDVWGVSQTVLPTECSEGPLLQKGNLFKNTALWVLPPRPIAAQSLEVGSQSLCHDKWHRWFWYAWKFESLGPQGSDAFTPFPALGIFWWCLLLSIFSPWSLIFMGHPEMDDTLDKDPSFDQYWLSSSHLPGMVLSTMDNAGNRNCRIFALLGLISSGRDR